MSHRWCWLKFLFVSAVPESFLEGLQKVTFRCCRGSVCVKHRCVFCILTWSWFSCWGDKRAATAECPDRDVWSSVNTRLRIIIKKISTHIYPSEELLKCPLKCFCFCKSQSLKARLYLLTQVSLLCTLSFLRFVLLTVFYLNAEGWLCFVSFWCLHFPSALTTSSKLLV